MATTSEQTLYVSGYTNEESVGIYQYTFDTKTGVLTPKGLAAKADNPSYLCLHKTGQHMYALSEVDEYKGQKTGYISTYTRDKETGKLNLVNEQPSGGEHPCHGICDATGNYLLVANYNGGSTSVLPIKNPGSPEYALGEISSQVIHNEHFKATGGVPDRQEKPHVHSVDLDPIAQQYVFVNDLGCDLLVTYKFDRQNAGSLAIHSTFEFPKGAGPRHLKFAPNHNHFCYVVTELSNDIFMLEFNFQEGKFNLIQQIHALPEDFTGSNTAAEIDITPNGKFMYASMRGYDAITIFEIDEWSGKLSLVGYQPTGGKYPRHFTLDPTGNFLLVGNKDSNNVVVFKIDQKTGALAEVSKVSHVQPTCIQFWN
ncbi:Lactonase, 7-bladed beta-propeller-domain-containing protein [Gilbertella persicaria]|uniref:Lactonase, 7-bladed beta-propeller-domain-containing protein n=1 Tax=Gilbertella persicaria TaxID=101096 RepID=UPI00222047BA|nr:Lactonase, 7-bladed beta-propeller-domain-containing protein [Gilbertella persicaria]KAI8075429.1 Lactonase, 7-bladed beta-propeller-domain-containing protein [Gilbertella persicaria]